MRQIAPFTALVLFVAWVAPPTARAQTPSPVRDSLLDAACVLAYADEFKKDGTDEQKAALMTSLLCQVVNGGCQKDPRGAVCKKSVRLLSEKLDKSGWSLPYMAATAGRTDLIKTLIELKVDVNKPPRRSGDSASGLGWTPLMIAASEGHGETVSALVEAGGDVNATNALGRTALMFASSYGFLAIVNDLLAHRADPNIVPKDSTGWTALIAAAHNGYREVVTTLLGHGADASIADKQGKTALAWAEAGGHVEVAQALRDLTAKR